MLGEGVFAHGCVHPHVCVTGGCDACGCMSTCSWLGPWPRFLSCVWSQCVSMSEVMFASCMPWAVSRQSCVCVPADHQDDTGCP